MSKICFRCGSPVDDSDRFCRACGAAIAAETANDDDAPDVFVLKPGTARLEVEEEAPETGTPAAPVKAPEPAPTATEEAPQKEPEQPKAAPQAAAQPMNRREKRIAKKLSRCESEEDEEDYVYPEEPKRRSHWKAKLISLFAAVLLIAALIGGVYLYQKVEQAAFAPIETAYEGFSARSPAKLEQAFYPELYSAMTDLGYLSAGGYWEERIDDWQSVYGRSFTAAPSLRKMTFLRGEEKQDQLNLLETEYGISPKVQLLVRIDYTVSVSADNVDASVRKSAHVGYVGGDWYLLQEEF